MAVGRAVRTWAVAHPAEYALLYGSPVPGYQAPRDTVEPAARVALVGTIDHAEDYYEHRLQIPASEIGL